VRDLGQVFKKRVLLVPPVLLRPLFWLLWHGTHGAVTTPPGAWKFLSYPIRVDPSRLAEVYGYACRYSSLEALLAEIGNNAKGFPHPTTDQAVRSPRPRDRQPSAGRPPARQQSP
jgi:hypothetical protein